VTTLPSFLGYAPSQVAAISYLDPKLGTSLTAQTDINGGIAGTITMATAVLPFIGQGYHSYNGR
jgi:hypothetical protein